MWHAATRRTATIPTHSGREVAIGTLRRIIRQAGLTTQEFIRLLGK
jgi:predicted RNA binding protein YcfA (HicA-like mRNA interferase family)